MEVVLVLVLAFVPVDFVSVEVDLLLLFEVGLELEDDEPMLELPWFPMLELPWFIESMPEPLELEPLWFEVPEDILPDILPDWLDD
ncbi:hypothetical protein [Pontibacter indicus]|uniref:hypothetical protein n=1 Tax=Pontibacter indicus TaxID=1317125 RepID=UPI00147B4719|nr:hypothetical protein [Pontibacter indicus]